MDETKKPAQAATEGPEHPDTSDEQTQVAGAPSEKKPRKESFVEFLMNSPLRGSDIDITRDPSPPREIDFS